MGLPGKKRSKQQREKHLKKDQERFLPAGKYGKQASRVNKDILQDLQNSLIFRCHQGIHPHRGNRLAVTCAREERGDQKEIKKRGSSGNEGSSSVFSFFFKSKIQTDTNQEHGRIFLDHQKQEAHDIKQDILLILDREKQPHQDRRKKCILMEVEVRRRKKS